MPLFFDFHKDMQGVSREDLNQAHQMDLDAQDKLGVKFHKFWVNEEQGFVFCLMEGPNKEACKKVHQMSHGKMACEIIEVTPTDVATFMGPGQEDRIGAVVHPDGKYDSAVRSFLFTDIVGSTKMTQQLGDTGSIKVLHVHNDIVRTALGEFAGKEIKHTGDGIMACFSSVSKCAHAAVRIQQDLEKHRTDNPSLPLHVKVGLNAGEPVTEGDDFFGAAVQLTARLCDLCQPDQILSSTVIKELCLGKGIQFFDVGNMAIKGFEDKVHITEVRWR